MKRIIAAAFIVSALFAFQNQANAAGQVSFFGGYLNPGGLSPANVRSGLDFHGTALYGARLEYDFLKIFGVEQNVAFSPRIFEGTIFPNSANGADARGFLYSSNFVVNIPMGHLVPFASGGLGLVHPWNIDPNPLGTKFAANYGGGVKLDRLAGPLGLRFDARGWTVPDYFGDTLNILEVSGGVTLSWGKK